MEDFPYRYEQFEIEYDLFDLKISGVPIWERMRHNVAREIKEQNGVGEAHTGSYGGFRDHIQSLLLFTKNIVFKNPFLAEDSDIIYVGHPRRKKQKDGYWWDPYTDPIHKFCNHNYTHFETTKQLKHYQPARTSNLRYLDLIQIGSAMQRKIGLNEPEILPSKKERLEEIETAIEARFGGMIDLVGETNHILHSRNTLKWWYNRWLQNLDPDLLVLVVSYGKETLIEACKQLRIPVVELQHGVIGEHHLGYSFSGPRTKKMFPDYLLTFGEFWKDLAEFPIADDRVIPVGYPFLEQRKRRHTEVKSKSQIIFVSQGTIGAELSKFALEVEEHPEIKHNIVYKLHPGEYDRWKKKYPWLVEADFEVIDSSEPPLYELFGQSSAQVGVSSTAVYEGLAFGLKSFVYKCSGSEILQPLLDEGAAQLVSTPEELMASLGTENESFEQEYYFEARATEKMCKTLNELSETAIPYE